MNREEVIKVINEQTEDKFVEYVDIIRNGKITSIAPLGMSGDDYVICNDDEYANEHDNFAKRSSHISFRKYGRCCEMFITDRDSNTLVYYQTSLSFSNEFIASIYFKIFSNIKELILGTIEEIENEIDYDNFNLTEGFKMLYVYQNSLKESENK